MNYDGVVMTIYNILKKYYKGSILIEKDPFNDDLVIKLSDGVNRQSFEVTKRELLAYSGSTDQFMEYVLERMSENLDKTKEELQNESRSEA